MQPFLTLGNQFIGYRDLTNTLKGTPLFCIHCVLLPANALYSSILSGELCTANKKIEDLALALAKSEKAREKAENDAKSTSELQQKLREAEKSRKLAEKECDEAKKALADQLTQQRTREDDVANRLETQNRRFLSKYSPFFMFVDVSPVWILTSRQKCSSRENS